MGNDGCQTQQTTAIAVLLAAAAVGFGLMGMSYFTNDGIDQERDHRIGEYMRAVETWDRSARERFSMNSEIGVQFILDGEQLPLNISLERDTTHSDRLKDPETPRDWSPLKYTYRGAFNLTQPWAVLSGSLVLVSPLGVVSMPMNFTKEERYGAIGWKVCDYQRHGAYFKDKCVVYKQLSSICVRLHWDDKEGVLRLSNDTLGHGCGRNRWEATTYSIVRVQRHKEASKMNISSISITARMDDDPFLVARNLTDGSLNFGVTHSQRIGAAIVLMVLAGISALVFFAILWCCCTEKGRSVWLRDEEMECRGFYDFHHGKDDWYR